MDSAPNDGITTDDVLDFAMLAKAVEAAKQPIYVDPPLMVHPRDMSMIRAELKVYSPTPVGRVYGYRVATFGGCGRLTYRRTDKRIVYRKGAPIRSNLDKIVSDVRANLQRWRYREPLNSPAFTENP